MTIEASPKKLRNGSWGCLAHSAGVRAGDTVTITTRAGKSWQARIERVVWTGDGKAICATASLDRNHGCDCGRCAECTSARQTSGNRSPRRSAAAAQADEQRAAQAAREAETPYRMSGGSGYGCCGWSEGQTVRSSERHREQGWPEYVTVVSATEERVREDGLSFGVGDDEGYLYGARCRAATEEEAAPVRERIAAREARKAAQAELADLVRRARDEGVHERPEDGGQIALDGERILGEPNLYGGGSWWVITDDAIWSVRNNGADGDDWTRNNVRTGGAGAIGRRLPRTEEIENALRRIAALLGEDV